MARTSVEPKNSFYRSIDRDIKIVVKLFECISHQICQTDSHQIHHVEVSSYRGRFLYIVSTVPADNLMYGIQRRDMIVNTEDFNVEVGREANAWSCTSNKFGCLKSYDSYRKECDEQPTT